MNTTRIIEPPFGAVLLSAVWEHLRIDVEGSPPESPLDATLSRNILTATKEFEKATRTAVIQQTLRRSFATVPSDGLRLVKPVQRVNSVTYYDSANTLQTVSASDYYLTDDFPPHVRFTTNWTAPTLYDRPDAIRVEFVAGFPADGSPPETAEDYAANVPADIQDAVLLQVEMLQANTSPQDREALENAFRCIAAGYAVPLSQA